MENFMKMKPEKEEMEVISQTLETLADSSTLTPTTTITSFNPNSNTNTSLNTISQSSQTQTPNESQSQMSTQSQSQSQSQQATQSQEQENDPNTLSDVLNNEYFVNPKVRPPFSYTYLIGQAILSSPQQKLTLSEITEWLMQTYPYFRYKENSWHNSVRNNLTLKKCFAKIPKDESTGKGYYWIVKQEMKHLFAKSGIFRGGKFHLKINSRERYEESDDPILDTPQKDNGQPQKSIELQKEFMGHDILTQQQLLQQQQKIQELKKENGKTLDSLSPSSSKSNSMTSISTILSHNPQLLSNQDSDSFQNFRSFENPIPISLLTSEGNKKQGDLDEPRMRSTQLQHTHSHQLPLPLPIPSQIEQNQDVNQSENEGEEEELEDVENVDQEMGEQDQEQEQEHIEEIQNEQIEEQQVDEQNEGQDRDGEGSGENE